MNFSIYLPDKLVEAIDRSARELNASRSAVIRHAIEAYLHGLAPGGWPAAVLDWAGDDQAAAFESFRGPEQREASDPFAADEAAR